jgi:hypothetical protein
MDAADTTEERIIMNNIDTNRDHQEHTKLPCFAWWHGFDYVFGYQIKLMRDLWGIDFSSRR